MTPVPGEPSSSVRRLSRRLELGTAVFLLVAILASSQPALAASCGIAITAQPSVVNYPSSSLPAAKVGSFSEILDVNYSSAYVNRTVSVQYFAGGDWHSAVNFTGNFVGFTRVYFPIVSASSDFGANSVRAVSGSCVSNSAAFTIQEDLAAPAWDVLLYASVFVLLLLFYLVGKRMGSKKFIILAAAVYLAVSPFTGHRYDVYFLVSSGIRVLQNVNPFGAGTPPVYPGPLKWAYPPLYVPYSALSFLIYQLITGASLPTVSALTHPSWFTSTYDVWQAFVPASLPVLVFLLKLPMVASALLTGHLLGKMMGTKSAVVAWLANPLVILVAAVWGQLDPIATLLAVAALYMFGKGRPYHAYLFASFGAAVKVWPVLLIPLFLVVSLRRTGRSALKPFLAIFPALLVTLALYASFGNFFDNLYTIAYARFVPTFGGVFSVNGLTWQQILTALNAPPVPLFTWVGIPALIAVAIWVYLKKEEDVTKWLIVSLMILFLTYNFVNPQYFYWIIPFLILQRRKLAAAMFSLIPMIYMMLAYDFFYFISPSILPSESSLGVAVAEQLKVSAFSQMPTVSSFAAPLLPTLAYVWLVYYEVKLKAHAVVSQT